MLYFIDIPILIAIWKLSSKNNKEILKVEKRKFILTITYAIVTICVTSKGISFALSEMEDKPYDKNMQVRIGSIYGYHFSDIYSTINVKDKTRYKKYEEIKSANLELVDYYSKNYEQENLHGIASGKNVIILQLESVQNFVINREINGKEITPNLNRFLKENIEFTNMTSQSYTTTADSEYSVLTSLYPLENGQAFSTYYSSINNDIFSLYKKNGYNTSYMHGNEKGFWNRGAVYSRMDLSEIVFIDDFEDTSEYINGYLSDELLYKQGVEKLWTYDKPFMTYIVAASSHTGFGLEGIQEKENKVTIDVRRI